MSKPKSEIRTFYRLFFVREFGHLQGGLRLAASNLIISSGGLPYAQSEVAQGLRAESALLMPAKLSWYNIRHALGALKGNEARNSEIH